MPIEVDKDTGEKSYWLPRRGKIDGIRVVGVDPETGIKMKHIFPIGPSIPMVKPCGAIVQVMLSNGAAGSVKPHIIPRKIGQGFVRADQCPMANGSMPKGLRDADDGGECDWARNDAGAVVTRGRFVEPCKHVIAIKVARERRHAKISEQYGKAYRSEESKQLEQMSDIVKGFMSGGANADGAAPSDETRQMLAEIKEASAELEQRKAEIESMLEEMRSLGKAKGKGR